MYTAQFRYLRPASLGEAQTMFRAASDARFLAGGHSLIPAMKQRLAYPSDLIDISRLAGLSFIRIERERLVIGAATTHAEVAASRDVNGFLPALASLAGMIGDPAVRHRGTLGGSIANNDPAADYPAAVIALNATITTQARKIAAEEFFTGMFETALEPGEIVTEVAFPRPRRAAYAKNPNPASRYAMPGVFVADLGNMIRVAVTGAASCVYRAADLESALTRRFAAAALESVEINPGNLTSDLFASADYRAHLVKIMAQRATGACHE
jgi:carbon-monoxide dehydrogenase medium subunit